MNERVIIRSGDSSGAMFSPCLNYRYVLWRRIDIDSPTALMVIGLNPSTADEREDDPTIRRCKDFARRWGHGMLYMLNLFAFRATDPKRMKAELYPVGPSNDLFLREYASKSHFHLAAWGAHGSWMGRSREVQPIIGKVLYCLKTTKSGEPAHPLYIPSSTMPFRLNDPFRIPLEIAHA